MQATAQRVDVSVQDVDVSVQDVDARAHGASDDIPPCYEQQFRALLFCATQSAIEGLCQRIVISCPPSFCRCFLFSSLLGPRPSLLVAVVAGARRISARSILAPHGKLSL